MARVADIFLDRPQLLKHSHEVEVVPRFDDLAALDADNGDSGKLRRQSGRGES